MKIIKALSFRQPWLWLILNHFKDIEIRTWNTKFRGVFALHASSTFDSQGYDFIKEHYNTISLPLKNTFAMGKIIGIASLFDILKFDTMNAFTQYSDRHLNDIRWFDGRQKGFILTDARSIPPIPMKGKLNFFNINIEVEDAKI